MVKAVTVNRPSLKNVKKMIQQKENLPPGERRLVFSGKKPNTLYLRLGNGVTNRAPNTSRKNTNRMRLGYSGNNKNRNNTRNKNTSGRKTYVLRLGHGPKTKFPTNANATRRNRKDRKQTRRR